MQVIYCFLRKLGNHRAVQTSFFFIGIRCLLKFGKSGISVKFRDRFLTEIFKISAFSQTFSKNLTEMREKRYFSQE